MTPNEIGTILESADRAKAAQEWLDNDDLTRERVRRIRDQAIAAMRISGSSQREVARHLDLSPGRVAQIDVEQGVTSVSIATMGLHTKNGAGHVANR